MDIHWDALEDVVVLLISGGIGGAISGAYVANWFTNRRHRKQRRAVLFAFLKVWESEVEANRPTTNRHNVRVGIAELFDERRLALIERAAPVELNYGGTKRTTFRKLVDKIRNMTPGEVERDTKDGKQTLLTAIRAITSFLEPEPSSSAANDSALG
jgi:hypothetical protein